MPQTGLEPVTDPSVTKRYEGLLCQLSYWSEGPDEDLKVFTRAFNRTSWTS